MTTGRENMLLRTPAATEFSVENPLPSPSVEAAQDGGLALRLRKGTIQAHEDVMQPPIVAKLVSGQLPVDIHLRYLMMLFRIYSALEAALTAHASHPLLSLVYDPALLSRADSIERDIAYYTGDPDWINSKSSSLWDDVEREGGALLRYVDRLKELGQNEDKATLLLAHSYVRYLGDLSGGQAIARTLRKSYSLPDSGEGSEFYEFFLPPSSPFSTKPSSELTSGLRQRADLSETKEIKAWFRQGLDSAGYRMSEEQRKEVVEEAKRAFLYNVGIFSSFDEVVQKWLEETKESKKADLDGSSVALDRVLLNGKRTQVREIVPSEKTGWMTVLGVVLATILAGYISLRDYGFIRI